MIEQFHFLRPWWFLLLLPCIAITILLWRYWRRQNSWQQVCDAHLLPHLLQGKVNQTRRWPLLLLLLAWLFAVIALAGPTWSRLPEPVYRSLAADVFVMDLSPAMLAADIKPNRLTRARYKLLDILHAERDVSVGLVAYSGEAYTVSPITEDANTIASMVPDLNPTIMPLAGNNLAMGLHQAQSLIQQAQAKPANVIVITASNANSDAIASARQLAKQGIPVSVIGIGSQQGGPITLPNGDFLQDKNGNTIISRLDTASLRQLAQAGAGDYIPFSSGNADVKAVMRLTPTQYALQSRQEKAKFNSWLDQGRWFLLVVLLLALLVFRKGWFDEVLR